MTLDQKLHSRKLHAPSGIIYWILAGVIRILNLKTKTKFTYKAYPGKEKGPIVFVANHASRNDFQFTVPACLPKKLNFVVGYNEFFRMPISIILKLMQVVPKKNFTPDLYCIKQVLGLVKQGNSICFMPEGMSSIPGMQHPVMPGTGLLIKKLGIPVYYSKISGAYLSYTKHCLDERLGKVEVVVDKMFSSEEIKELSPEQIEDRMNQCLAHDDYIWNKKARVKYKGKSPMTKNLDTLLYLCPKCGAMHKMKCEESSLICTECGNTININEYYDITPASEKDVCPELITDWTIMERQKAHKDVEDKNFSFEEHVKIGVIPDYKQLWGDDTSKIVGDGILKLDHDGLHFRGTKSGLPFNFDLKTDNVPSFGMCTDISRFYTFVDGKFIEFYPDSRDVLRWDQLTEEMHRVNGGKWQNTEYRHRED